MKSPFIYFVCSASARNNAAWRNTALLSTSNARWHFNDAVTIREGWQNVGLKHVCLFVAQLSALAFKEEIAMGQKVRKLFFLTARVASLYLFIRRTPGIGRFMINLRLRVNCSFNANMLNCRGAKITRLKIYVETRECESRRKNNTRHCTSLFLTWKLSNYPAQKLVYNFFCAQTFPIANPNKLFCMYCSPFSLTLYITKVMLIIVFFLTCLLPLFRFAAKAKNAKHSWKCNLNSWLTIYSVGSWQLVWKNPTQGSFFCMFTHNFY